MVFEISLERLDDPKSFWWWTQLTLSSMGEDFWRKLNLKILFNSKAFPSLTLSTEVLSSLFLRSSSFFGLSLFYFGSRKKVPAEKSSNYHKSRTFSLSNFFPPNFFGSYGSRGATTSLFQRMKNEMIKQHDSVEIDKQNLS